MNFKRGITALVAAGLLVVVAACSKGDENLAWQKVNQGALLVDVRSLEEYNAGHLPEAKLIPVGEIGQRLSEFGEDKNRPIVVYCKSGVRSGRAQAALQENGYTDVTNGGGYSALMSVKP